MEPPHLRHIETSTHRYCEHQNDPPEREPEEPAYRDIGRIANLRAIVWTGLIADEVITEIIDGAGNLLMNPFGVAVDTAANVTRGARIRSPIARRRA